MLTERGASHCISFPVYVQHLHLYLPFLIYETCWYFWAETCSSLETTYCYTMKMVLFDGGLRQLIVPQHNGMSFVRVIVAKLYVI
jgi:hypothetical protein